MKNGIHPKCYENATVTCACGESWETGSTRPELKIEICSGCHPFFTGKQKFVDTAGKVDKFQKKYGDRRQLSVKKSKREVKPTTTPEETTDE